jgi:hypothetical protein
MKLTKSEESGLLSRSRKHTNTNTKHVFTTTFRYLSASRLDKQELFITELYFTAKQNQLLRK